MDPDMDRSKGKKRLEAGRTALPADDQAAGCLLGSVLNVEMDRD